jgi:hypothetical protein
MPAGSPLVRFSFSFVSPRRNHLSVVTNPPKQSTFFVHLESFHVLDQLLHVEEKTGLGSDKMLKHVMKIVQAFEENGFCFTETVFIFMRNLFLNNNVRGLREKIHYLHDKNV